MYSWEIGKFLLERNYVLNRDEYMEITPQNCPQITRVSYNTAENSFTVYTNDGYEFHFKVRNYN